MRNIDKIAGAIRIINEVKEDIKAQQLTILMALMTNYPEPLNYPELAQAAGISEASVSRNCKILGDKLVQDPKTKKWINTGLQLLQPLPNPKNTREYVVQLTKQGLALMRQLEKAIA